MKQNTDQQQRQNEKAHAVLFQITNIFFGSIAALLATRFLFRMSGANPAASIVELVYDLSRPFLYPFMYMFPRQQISPDKTIEPSTLVAIFGYLFLSWIVQRLISLSFTASTTDIKKDN